MIAAIDCVAAAADATSGTGYICIQRNLSYTCRVTSKKGVIGFGHPMLTAALSRNRNACGFFVRAPVFAARMGGRKPCRLSSSAVGPVDQPVRAASSFGHEVAVVQSRQLEPIMANTLTPVQFHGATLFTTTINGVPHVAMRQIVEAIGLDWAAQFTRIKNHPVLSKGIVVTTIPSSGGDQQTTLLPLDKLNGWLFGVSVRRVKPELRERLTQYQAECFDVLAQHFGVAVKPPVSDFVPSLVNRRWIVSFDHNGKECVQSIPHDAMLVTWDEIVHLVSDHSLMLTNAQLANLAKAATDRIARRIHSQGVKA